MRDKGVIVKSKEGGERQGIGLHQETPAREDSEEIGWGVQRIRGLGQGGKEALKKKEDPKEASDARKKKGKTGPA